MNKNLFIILYGIIQFIVATQTFGQFAQKAPESDDGEIWTMTDVPPKPDGGMQGLYSYLSKKLKCSARKADTDKVMVQFIVDSTGYIRKGSVKFIDSKYINNQTVKGHISEQCGRELISIFEKCPQWTPGYIKELDKNVAVRIALPVNFK